MDSVLPFLLDSFTLTAFRGNVNNSTSPRPPNGRNPNYSIGITWTSYGNTWTERKRSRDRKSHLALSYSIVLVTSEYNRLRDSRPESPSR